MASGILSKGCVVAILLVVSLFALASVSEANHHVACVGDCVTFSNCPQACLERGLTGGECVYYNFGINCCCTLDTLHH
ncbi:hypothetical protein QJS04_geneDACA014439 [Acorus gramineus]|uniref:Uncharacterized protein n=1 Tax=Acorus gramineus TaxID=55184 RepID=A0AAV9BQ79_ACOGR|nr:hypothetical protein QJS04_geneDACA014439 [Acorus gramineus]